MKCLVSYTGKKSHQNTCCMTDLLKQGFLIATTQQVLIIMFYLEITNIPSARTYPLNYLLPVAPTTRAAYFSRQTRRLLAASQTEHALVVVLICYTVQQYSSKCFVSNKISSLIHLISHQPVIRGTQTKVGRKTWKNSIYCCCTAVTGNVYIYS